MHQDVSWVELHQLRTSLRRHDRVVEQACDGHLADAAGDWRYERCAAHRLLGGDVADDTALAVRRRDLVDPDVDDDGVLPDPVAADHLRAADRGYKDFRRAAERRKVSRLGM